MTDDKEIKLTVTVRGVEPSSANEVALRLRLSGFAIERKVRSLELDGFEEVIAEVEE